MVKNVLPRTIQVELLSYIPKDGVSYPLFLSTNNPCYESVTVTLAAKLATNAPFLTITPSVLTFTKGEYNVNYTLTLAPDFPLA